MIASIIDRRAHVLLAAGCLALLTPHKTYDLEWIAGDSQLVFDARNAYGGRSRRNVVRL